MTAALKLKDRGFDVAVLERETRAGGVIGTFAKDGFKAESGSNTVMVQSKKTLDFLDRLAIKSSSKQRTPPQRNAFL